jgi:hypothetical protein
LVGFSNSDWDYDPNERKSIAAYFFLLDYRVVMWACKKQHAIYLSSAEEEY